MNILKLKNNKNFLIKFQVHIAVKIKNCLLIWHYVAQ
jgi:hypothetical protein